MSADELPKLVASIQTWAKGFRVSERSEEFQLVVPPSKDQLSPIEPAFATVEWGEVLLPLYQLKPALLAREFALLLTPTAATAVSCRHSEDKRGRRSVVVVASTVGLAWESPDLPARFATTSSLCARLAEMYGTVLRGARPEVQRQLRDGSFLRNRMFDLQDEEVDSSTGWTAIAREIKRWRGIRGIATKHMVGVGANVLYGTEDEAIRYRSDAVALDGFLDVSRAEIFPMSDALSLWPARQPELAPQTFAMGAQESSEYRSTDVSDPLERIEVRLDQLARQQTRTHSLVEAVLDSLKQFWMIDTRKKKK